MTKQQLTLAQLDARGIHYRVIYHSPVYTIEEMEQLELNQYGEIAKNLFLRNANGKTHYVVSMLKDKHPDIQADIRGQLGCSRLSFAPPEYMEKYLNCTPGSASVLGLVFDTECNVRLIIDRDLLNESVIGCHPCINTSSLAINREKIIEKIIPATNHTPTYVEL